MRQASFLGFRIFFCDGYAKPPRRSRRTILIIVSGSRRICIPNLTTVFRSQRRSPVDSLRAQVRELTYVKVKKQNKHPKIAHLGSKARVKVRMAAAVLFFFLISSYQINHLIKADLDISIFYLRIEILAIVAIVYSHLSHVVQLVYPVWFSR